MTKIKLCGMKRVDDVIAARELGADYAGFILTGGFSRTVSFETFCELVSSLDGSDTIPVGVFVNEPIDSIVNVYAERLGMIQLHGSESNDYIRELRERTDKPIIKAFKITSQEDIQKAITSPADYVLLDSGTGTGRVFDHSLVSGIDRPYFLAGGLDAENVGAAINALHPFAVDASSSLETNGTKDKLKMTEFVNAVRRKG